MKAIVYTEYGSPDVLCLTEIGKPMPKDNEVLIKVQATPVGFGDIVARRMGRMGPGDFHMSLPFWLMARLMFGFRRPKVNILGGQLAGQIEAVGKDVTRFKAGDPVFAYCGASMGANAEYVCLPEDGMVARKPDNMSYAEAATIPYGVTMALPILQKVNLQPGQKVLINGASGGIGAAALQLAKHHFGAEVTAVCGGPRVDFVKALGADQVIDYGQEDFTRNGQTYDVILDILGKSSFSAVKGSLKPNGVYLLASFKMKPLLQMVWTSVIGGKKVICALATEKVESLILAKALVEAGKMKAGLDKCYPLAETAEAHRYLEAGDHQGPVVIMVGQN